MADYRSTGHPLPGRRVQLGAPGLCAAHRRVGRGHDAPPHRNNTWRPGSADHRSRRRVDQPAARRNDTDSASGRQHHPKGVSGPAAAMDDQPEPPSPRRCAPPSAWCGTRDRVLPSVPAPANGRVLPYARRCSAVAVQAVPYAVSSNVIGRSRLVVFIRTKTALSLMPSRMTVAPRNGLCTPPPLGRM
jgi:hypothetical protein